MSHADADVVRLLAVDGNSMAHRAWHAISGSQDETGEFVAAGVLGLVSTVWHHGPYDAVVIAFDHPVNARRLAHAHYKAGRETDPDLAARLLDLPGRIAATGIATVTEHGLEADDLVAALVDRASARTWRTDVLSGDQDLTALVGPSVRLLRPRATMADLVVTTPAVVQRVYGVRPDQYRAFAALRGDPSDGLAGVHGIGPKAAAQLMRDFDHLERLLACLAWLPTKVERAIRAGRHRVLENLAIMSPMVPTQDLGPVLDRARVDLDEVITVLEDLGADDPGLARAARRLVWAGQRSASPLPEDVPLPHAPLPRDDESFDDEFLDPASSSGTLPPDDAALVDAGNGLIKDAAWDPEELVELTASQDSLF